MKLKTVPARLGVMWVRAGFRVFFRQPLAFGAMFALVGLAVLLLLQLPFIGPVLALAVMPAATLSFMLATQAALGQKPARPDLLLAPWREPLQRRRLVMLGLLYALSVLLVSLLVAQLDGERFDEAMKAVAEGTATPEMLQDAGLATGLALRLLALSLLSLVFWHAPALIHWGRMGVAQALFASVLACARSLGAFTLLGLTWMGVMIAFALLAQIFFTMLGRPEAAALAMLPGGMMFSTVFYASLYFTFVDSFELDEPDEPVAIASA